jgi:hypothetical protein
MKTVVLFLLIMLCMTSVFAQIDFEVAVGVGAATFKERKSSNGNTTFSRGPHFQFGVTGELSLSQYTAIKAGVNYSRRGTGIETPISFGGIVGSDYSQLTANYIEVPMMFAIKPEKFIVFVGPQFSFLVNAEYGSTNLKGDFNTSSVDIRFGGGIRGKKGLGFQFQLVKGLSNILNQENVKWTSNYFCIMATYRIKG